MFLVRELLPRLADWSDEFASLGATLKSNDPSVVLPATTKKWSDFTSDPWCLLAPVATPGCWNDDDNAKSVLDETNYFAAAPVAAADGWRALALAQQYTIDFLTQSHSGSPWPAALVAAPPSSPGEAPPYYDTSRWDSVHIGYEEKNNVDLKETLAGVRKIENDVDVLLRADHERRENDELQGLMDIASLESKMSELATEVSSQKGLIHVIGSRQPPEVDYGRLASVENDLEEWKSQLGTLLGDQTQTFLQALNCLNVKLLARLTALESDFASFRLQDCPSHSNDRMAEGASTGRALPSTVKNKVFHPGCRHGVACRFLHIDGEAEGSCSDIDEEALEAYENARCVGCGFHPIHGLRVDLPHSRRSRSQRWRE